MSPASCPACTTTVLDSHRFCPGCGASLDLDSPTGTAPRRSGLPPTPPASRGGRDSRPSSRTPSRPVERFAPGSILIGRYRIVGLLGRGGMGEVYRADDLKLEQPVALKFLPRALEGDPERLERLYGEVRMARQVSHPHVCRVWDVGEAEGQHFLSMEFVDGENLASLLRRIGRLPGDKALEIAGQIAAGLAAAHDQGVLHRDLKPANVMLDGKGQVRLTDFGLAGLAETLSGDDILSGTPSYMSPEQLQGRAVTTRSDVYALGLLLYELFTGRRAFEGRSTIELARRQRDERPVDPSLIVPDLDAAVERTILACLEKEPRRRPPSAHAVLAMLSGRDPLAAALAAGDTPSPELVAAAGETARTRPTLAWAAVAVVACAVVVTPIIRASTSMLALVPVEKSPAALEDRARELLARLGATGPASDSEVGFSSDGEYVRWVEEHDRTPRRWDALRTGEPPVLRFWYRQSPRPLAAPQTAGVVTWADPPAHVSGMAGVLYDLRGRLVAFYSVPPQVDEPAPPAAAVDWAPLLAEARLDPARLRAVPPQRTPPFFCDARAAWETSWSGPPEIPLRVEVASYRGRPVWFEMVNPWTRAERMQPWQPTANQTLARNVGITVVAVLVLAAVVLARRNARLGRLDRRGAARLAVAVAFLGCLAWSLHVHHVADPGAEFGLVARGASMAVLSASLLWLFYLALEPYVRRTRPWTLVSWTRALNGGTRDAVVGRDVLIGMGWGASLAVVLLLADLLPAWLGGPASQPDAGAVQLLLGVRQTLALLAALPIDATVLGLGALLLFVVLRFLTRRDSLAVLLILAILTVNQAGNMSAPAWFTVPICLLIFGTYIAMLLRFGVLAAIAGLFTANLLLAPPQTWALGSWQGAASAVTLPVLVALAALALRTATSDRSVPAGPRVGDSSSSRGL